MKNELLKWFDRPVAFHRVFVDLTGNVQSALMLSQAFYWSKRTSNEEGWFYKSASEWQSETGLSRHEQETARKHLRKTSFWKEKLKGVPATCHFMIDNSALFSSLTDLAKLDSQFAGMSETSLPESGKHSITETTTETTSADSKESASQKTLFDSSPEKGNTEKKEKKVAPKKESEPVHPAYPEFVRIWTEAYPELGFNALSGKKIKSLISQSEAILTGGGKVPTPEAAGHLFAYMLAYVKREGHWLRGKSIAVWESKYREIYFEIKNGKPRAGKKESASEYINRYFGQAN